jgi:hypothetical protein
LLLQSAVTLYAAGYVGAVFVYMTSHTMRCQPCVYVALIQTLVKTMALKLFINASDI